MVFKIKSSFYIVFIIFFDIQMTLAWFNTLSIL